MSTLDGPTATAGRFLWARTYTVGPTHLTVRTWQSRTRYAWADLTAVRLQRTRYGAPTIHLDFGPDVDLPVAVVPGTDEVRALLGERIGASIPPEAETYLRAALYLDGHPRPPKPRFLTD